MPLENGIRDTEPRPTTYVRECRLPIWEQQACQLSASRTPPTTHHPHDKPDCVPTPGKRTPQPAVRDKTVWFVLTHDLSRPHGGRDDHRRHHRAGSASHQCVRRPHPGHRGRVMSRSTTRLTTRRSPPADINRQATYDASRCRCRTCQQDAVVGFVLEPDGRLIDQPDRRAPVMRSHGPAVGPFESGRVTARSVPRAGRLGSHLGSHTA